MLYGRIEQSAVAGEHMSNKRQRRNIIGVYREETGKKIKWQKPVGVF